jgi:hypothetical protein
MVIMATGGAPLRFLVLLPIAIERTSGAFFGGDGRLARSVIVCTSSQTGE